MRILSVLLASLSASLLSLPALAQWQLVNEQSQFHFISIKKDTVAETHLFKQLSGAVDKQGKVIFTVDLNSVETNIPIRNQRMTEFLFNTATFATATFSTNVDTALLASLKAGESTELELTGTVDLHGIQQPITSKVLVLKKHNGDLFVVNQQPIIINAQSYNLTGGVNKLKELASLPSISFAVPVTFNLTFTQQ